MKKVLLLIMTLITVIGLTACKAADNDNEGTGTDNPGTITDTPDTDSDNSDAGSDNSDAGSDKLTGSLEEILDKIYETADVDDNFKSYIKDGLLKEEVTAERTQYFLGKADLEFEEALASEPMIQPGAYSLVLVRVKEGTDIEQFKKDIKDNIDPMKWVCVGVKEENIIVDNIGDIVFLVMSDDQAKPLHEAFLALEK
jgi:hypothetical protein